MKKLLRILLAEVIVVVVLAVALVVLILNPVKSEAESYVLSARNATEIAAVHVEHEAGAIDVKTQDGGFLVEGVPAELMDVDLFIEY